MGPYLEFAPELAYVLTDDAGVCGYVLGRFVRGIVTDQTLKLFCIINIVFTGIQLIHWSNYCTVYIFRKMMTCRIYQQWNSGSFFHMKISIDKRPGNKSQYFANCLNLSWSGSNLVGIYWKLVRTLTATCYRCGWHPVVLRGRLHEVATSDVWEILGTWSR